MQYHCLIYFDPKVVFADTPEARDLHASLPAKIEQLKSSGNLVAMYPLNLPSEAMTVEKRDGRITTTDGPFMETKDILGGLVVIEARDMNDAIRVAGDLPHATLGHIEVRPAIDYSKPRPQL